jgi:hypothetical protein
MKTLDQETIDGNSYLRTAARLAAVEGAVLAYTKVHEQGVLAVFQYLGSCYYSFYLKPSLRHNGNYKHAVSRFDCPIITSSNCDLEPYLLANDIEHICLGKRLPREYDIISDHYQDIKAKRSGIPYINHIQEGLTVLTRRANSVDSDVVKAFCLHPIFQDPSFFNLKTRSKIEHLQLDPVIVCLAMEYKEIANAHLVKNHGQPIRLSTCWEVNEMLVADKIQNYKDFQDTYKGTQEEYNLRDQYFKDWLNVLGVTWSEYYIEALALRALTGAPFFNIDESLIA